MKVRFETTGCRLNQIESESAARSFIEEKFDVLLAPLTAKSEPDSEASLCVVNTCAVTQKAEQKDRRIIRLVLEKCPHAVVLVTGCYAQLSSDEIKKMSDRVAVLPGQLKSRLSEVPSLLRAELLQGNFEPKAFARTLNEGIFARPAQKAGFSENAFKLSTDSFVAHSRSSIKIQDGCNNDCTYCTINAARGHSVSLDAQTVIDRVIQLEKAGQAEVVFTTVNIGQYRGAYKGGFVCFTELLELCLKNTSEIAMRISSLYPEVVDDEFCRVIQNPRVRPHFHISVQSGSDAVLSCMARRYTAADVREACRRLTLAKQNPFLACDIITGFPGETAEDFEATMALCQDCGFAWVHVFPFSARPGTAAAVMGGKVPQSVSGERAARLGAWAEQSKKAYITSCVGKEFDAVMESVKRPMILSGSFSAPLSASARKHTVYHAVTENFLHCELLSTAQNAPEPGSKIRVRIVGIVEAGAVKGGEYDVRAEFV